MGCGWRLLSQRLSGTRCPSVIDTRSLSPGDAVSCSADAFRGGTPKEAIGMQLAPPPGPLLRAGCSWCTTSVWSL